MSGKLSFFPDSASSYSSQVDAVMFSLLGLCGVIVISLALVTFYFIVRYRDRGNPTARASHPERRTLEYAWLTIPFLIFIGLFGWASNVYFRMHSPPENSLEVFVVAKQWMWKFQHPNGQKELDELHIPVGQPVKLVMISQDVIHSFYVPAFRIKQDLLPGRYTYTWFQATRPGIFHLFCSEYCGTAHSHMIGKIIALTPAEYQTWLSKQETTEEGLSSEHLSRQSLPAQGLAIFKQLGCQTCHGPGGPIQAPSLFGIYGKSVRLQTGQSIPVDETYLRDSILNPKKNIVKGYDPVMPSYQGRVSEEDLLAVIEYIKSLQFPTQKRPQGTGANQNE